jgi:ParB-like chromosome segregation protein Spo0J
MPTYKRKPAEPEAAAVGMRIVYRTLESLRPYARNSRTHGAKQIAKLEASLARFGWTNPLLIAGDELLAGHARLEAALNIARRGGKIARHDDVRIAPTIDLSALTPAERRAYVIADNRLATEAGWDNELVRIELSELKTDGFDLSLTGFSTIEIGTLLGKAEPAQAPVLAEGMRYQVVVDCADEHHQATILEEMRSRGLKAQPLIL